MIEMIKGSRGNIYARKKQFVNELQPALQELPEIEEVEYFYIEKTGEEFVRIKYEASRTYVCVSADSESALLLDVARAIQDKAAAPLITNEEHCRLLDQWIEEIQQGGENDG